MFSQSPWRQTWGFKAHSFTSVGRQEGKQVRAEGVHGRRGVPSTQLPCTEPLSAHFQDCGALSGSATGQR